MFLASLCRCSFFFFSCNHFLFTSSRSFTPMQEDEEVEENVQNDLATRKKTHRRSSCRVPIVWFRTVVNNTTPVIYPEPVVAN